MHYKKKKNFKKFEKPKFLHEFASVYLFLCIKPPMDLLYKFIQFIYSF